MRRLVPAALLLCAAVSAQGVEDWIDVALDPRVAPEQRIDALKKVAQTKEGLDRLAERGLDGKLEPEVVHAVVDTLLKAADYRPYVERVVRLLVIEKHRTNVLRRVQGVWEADRGLPLLDVCIAMSGKDDAAAREAALLALTRIPRRRAAEAIVDAGLRSNDETVKRVAREYVARLFGVATLKEASDYLLARKLDSFQDLVDERIRTLIEKEKENEEYRRRSLETATLAEALDEMEKGGTYRVYSAQRIRKLAEQNGIKDPSEFARRVFGCVADETLRDPPDAAVLAALLGSLQKYAGELGRAKKPEEVRETIQRVARLPGSGEAHQEVGREAVRLLGAVDDEGIALYAFAEGFPSVNVRKEAIQQLGLLAQRHSKRSNFVSIKLATLLSGAEKEPAIRAQILNLLTLPHIAVASEPVDVVGVVAGYLARGASPELADAETRDCAIILGRRRTEEARRALLALARTHPKPQVRQVVVEEGLLPWGRTDDGIHTELIEIVVSKDQPQDARRAVIDALGRKGGRRSAVTLETLKQHKDVSGDEVLVRAIREAKLELLGRLANGKGAAADAPEQKPLDLEAAIQILEQEIDGDAERLEPLASRLVEACDGATVPAGTARYRLATLHARLPADKRKDDVLLRRYREAAGKALPDKLPAELRETLLLEYRELLRNDPADAERARRAMECSRDLAKLAVEAQAKDKAAGYWLDAAEAAANLNDGALARKFLEEAALSGGVVGELVVREQKLRERIDLLPRG